MSDVAMVRIHNTGLTVDDVADHAGQRLIRVRYDLVVDPTGALVGDTITERVVVVGIDLHDAPVAANPNPVAARETTFLLTAGTATRRFEQVVNRIALDVEQDWWSTDQGGGTVPIAEWVDHLVGQVSLWQGEVKISEATTPVVRGSWGALGQS